ncbi:MAG: hypothetical protein GXO17_00400 [Thermodesulfobacteria bacterium]|nr:hypothetical protein [Thermodesulfobacteriota bacterium]
MFVSPLCLLKIELPKGNGFIIFDKVCIKGDGTFVQNVPHLLIDRQTVLLNFFARGYRKKCTNYDEPTACLAKFSSQWYNLASKVMNKEDDIMATKHPRLCVVLDPDTFERIKLLAKIRNVSMSSLVCDLVKVALDLEEDLLFADFLESREKNMPEGVEKKYVVKTISKEEKRDV